MSQTIALIPARMGSKGIPNKNFRLLEGKTPVARAIEVAHKCGLKAVVTTDHPGEFGDVTIHRPEGLATSHATMEDVVRHAVTHLHLEPTDIVVLLQPTQPLRTMQHISGALAAFWRLRIGTVATVVRVPDPRTVSIDGNGFVKAWPSPCRQDEPFAWRLDGTAYVMCAGRPFAHPITAWNVSPNDSCPLDTEDDWAEAERRLRERYATV